MTFSIPRGRHMLLAAVAAGMLLPLGACMNIITRQGNVLKPDQVAQVQLQDSRFEVESRLGTPVLKDDLHPNRAIYMEQYNNPKTGEHFMRRLEITYNSSGRVKAIKRFGFPKLPSSEGEQPASDSIQLPGQ